MTEAQAAHVMKQILEGISYLHLKGIAHRDIKPENILLVAKTGCTMPSVKLADLGYSIRSRTGRMRSDLGSVSYVAPEMALMFIEEGVDYGVEVDVWAAGVVTFVMITNRFPFYGDTFIETCRRIVDCDYLWPTDIVADISPELESFIERIFVSNPPERYTAIGALGDPWLRAKPSEIALHPTPSPVFVRRSLFRRMFRRLK